ncbi:MAG: glycosyltransferase family 2 protein [Pseudomonadota bacterium]
MNSIEKTVQDANSPLVSVVVPFYNAENTLLDTVRSVLAQTYGNWELLLNDDGSRDGSLALARRIADPRVRVFSDGQNRGVIQRRRELTGYARGDYVAMIDSDDLMHPERLERQLAYMRTHPECDVLCSAAVSMSEDMRAVALRDLGPLDVSPEALLRTGSIIQPSVMAKTDWLRSNSYREGYDRAEDRELWVRTHGSSVVAKLPEPLTYYREVGVFSLPKFVRSYRTERKVLLEFGPAMIGRSGTFYLWARSWLKTLAIRLIHALGFGEWLIRRRFSDGSGLESYQLVIERIRKIPVPGIE